MASEGRARRLLRNGHGLASGLAASAAALLGITAGLSDLTTPQRTGLYVATGAAAGLAGVVQASDRRRRSNTELKNRQASTAIDAPAAFEGDLFQLPRDVDDFVGQATELDRAKRFIEVHAQGAVPVVGVSGKGGVGKTAFIIHLAHELRAMFPDGQLFVDLRSAEGTAIDVHDVLAGLLTQLGVSRAAVPESLDERSRLFRARLDGRRILVLLDDAIDESQVRPLLPGSPGCAVLVTRRASLVGLANSLQLLLDELTLDQSVELLSSVAGAERVESERSAATEIARLCGNLPLAVRIIGNRLAGKRHWTIATTAERLRDETRRLVELAAGDLEVRATMAVSYHDLNPEERQIFRLMSTLRVQDFSAWLPSAALGIGLADIETALERLVDMQMLMGRTGSTPDTRYSYHTLLHLFARELSADMDSGDSQVAVLKSAVQAYVSISEQAYRQIEMGDIVPVPSAADASRVKLYVDSILRPSEFAWFKLERANLITIVEQAYENALYDEVCRLAVSLYGAFSVGAHWQSWQSLYHLALDAASKLDADRYKAEIMMRLGDVYKNSGRVDGPKGIPEPDREDLVAAQWLERSCKAFSDLGDERSEIAVLRRLAGVYRDLGYYDRAFETYESALKRARSIDDAQLLGAYVLRGLACLQRMMGNYTEAVANFGAALTAFEDANDQRGRLGALRGLGETHRCLEQWEQAEQCLRDHLEVDRSIGDRHAEAHMLCGLADIRFGQRRYSSAVRYFDECIPIFKEIGHRSSLAEATEHLGVAQIALGRRSDAIRSLTQARDVYSQLSMPGAEARTGQLIKDATGTGYWVLAKRRLFGR